MSSVDDASSLGLGRPRYYPSARTWSWRIRQVATPHGVSGLPWSIRYHRLLRISDGLVLITVALVSQLTRFGWDNEEVGHSGFGYTYFSLVIAALWMGALGLYRSRDSRVLGIGTDEYKRVISATVGLLGLLAIVILIFKVDVARGYFALAVPLGVVGLIGSRWTLRQWLTKQRTKGHYLSRVIVLGTHKDVHYVVNQIHQKSGAAYEVVGAALPVGDSRTRVVVGNVAVPVVSDTHAVVDAVRQFGADAVIVAGHVKGGSKFVQQLGWKLEESRTELVLATGLTNVAGPRIHSRPVEGLPLMHVELPQYVGTKHMVKRLFDIALSLAALIVLLPVFVVLAILIHRDSPGPIIFRQERVGRAGKHFLMYKFRSMVATAEDDLPALLDRNEGAGLLFKLEHDPRVTRIGSILRHYSLDELPQFWNVLRGQMSLVGPRPPLPSEVQSYKSRVHRRLYIKPGVTGMWQINGRSQLNWQDSVRLDLYYVENWSLAGDIIILWRTVKMLFKPVGAY